jgi:hypothetical protein
MKIKIVSFALNNALAYYNTAVVVVNCEVVGLDPVFDVGSLVFLGNGGS